MDKFAFTLRSFIILQLNWEQEYVIQKFLIQKSDPQRYSYRWGIRSLTNFGDFINPANRQAQLLAYQPPKSVLSINYINQVRLYNQVHHIFFFLPNPLLCIILTNLYSFHTGRQEVTYCTISWCYLNIDTTYKRYTRYRNFVLHTLPNSWWWMYVNYLHQQTNILDTTFNFLIHIYDV